MKKTKTFIHLNNIPINNKYSEFRDYRSVMFFNIDFFNRLFSDDIQFPELFIFTGKNPNTFNHYLNEREVILFSSKGTTPVTKIIATNITKGIYKENPYYEFDISMIDKNVPHGIITAEAKGIFLDMETSIALDFLKSKNNEYQNLYVYNDIINPVSDKDLVTLNANYYLSKVEICSNVLSKCFHPFSFDSMAKTCFFYEFCENIYKMNKD